jgi:hypothetical protein
MATKYSKSTARAEANYHPLRYGVKIHSDGVIEAAGFRDNTLEGLEFEEILNVGVKFKRQVDDETHIDYVPQTTKIFRTNIKRSFSVKNAFGLIKSKVRKFLIEKLDRFKHSSKRIKNEIRKILKDKSVFNFTRTRHGEQWNQVYIDSTTYGPYNYDVKLETDSDLSFFNDVLVVKTGGFSGADPEQETIVYMSPHDIVTYEGSSHYLITGETLHTGVDPDLELLAVDPVTYARRDLGLTNSSESHAPSSKMISIPKGQVLAYGHTYNFHNDAEADRTETYDVEPEDSIIAQLYPEYSQKMKIDGTWDGVIPSGAWFRVETWSFNSQNIGYAGNIKIVPTENIECSYSSTVSAGASDLVYEEAKNKAEQKASQKFHRELNSYLVNKGVKNENSKMRRYRKLKSRVATNVYDGLADNRTQITTKIDSTSLNYYDGTSPAYGGSKNSSNFDYTTLTSTKMEDGKIYGQPAIGVMPSHSWINSTALGEGAETEPNYIFNHDTNDWEEVVTTDNSDDGGTY